MDFKSPARKKKRRSTFLGGNITCYFNENSSSNGASGRTKSTEINEYLQKLEVETQKWVDYKKKLKERENSLSCNYKTNMPQSHEAYLSKEEEDYIDVIKIKVEEFTLIKNSLPNIEESYQLLVAKLKKQLLMTTQILIGQEICVTKMEEIIFDNLFDTNKSLNELNLREGDSSSDNNHFLFIDGV